MEILNKFGVQPVLLLAQLVNFTILLVLLNKFLYKPIIKVLEERRQKIENSLKQAEETQQKYAEAEERKSAILAEAKKEADKIIEEAKKEAKKLADDIQSSAKIAAQNQLERTQMLLALEKQKILNDAKKEIIELVALTTEKVTKSLLKEPEKNELIESALKELESERR